MKDLMKKALGDDGSDDMKKDAKLKVLKELRSMASGMMGDDLKDGMMKKVTVASPNKEGLKEGLDKAKEILGEHAPDEGSDEEEASESPEEEASEDEDLENCSPEEIDAKIAKLQEYKKKMQSSPSYS